MWEKLGGEANNLQRAQKRKKKETGYNIAGGEGVRVGKEVREETGREAVVQYTRLITW